MKDKKQSDYKVSWGSWKGVGEILVHVALALSIVYTLYSFFHQEEAEGNTAEKTMGRLAD